MAEKFVTLYANPRKRKRRRNPNIQAMTKQALPGMEEVLGGGLGAAAALEVPNMFALTGWSNVAVSALASIGGAIAANMAVSKTAGAAFGMVGGIISLFKAAHVATNGAFGIAPNTRLLPPPVVTTTTTQAAAGLRGRVGRTTGYAPALPAPTRVGAVRSGIAAFRESEFSGSPSGGEVETLLV